MKNRFFQLFLLAISLGFIACEKDEPTIPNEEEVITTMRLYLTPTTGGNPIVFEFKDLDGDGGNAPTITSDTLATNSTYSGVIELLNETETPADTITLEILAEDTDHQFFFVSTVSGTSASYNDLDGNNQPIGQQFTLTTGSMGYGQFTVTLRHEPDKSAQGVSGGDITNAGGETDIEVSFDLHVHM